MLRRVAAFLKSEEGSTPVAEVALIVVVVLLVVILYKYLKPGIGGAANHIGNVLQQN